MKVVSKRIITGLIVFGFLLSYVPMVSLENCPEKDHSKRMNLDCGNLFHCAFILNIGFLGNFFLPLKGWVFLINYLPHKKLIPRSIFHPPKYQ